MTQPSEVWFARRYPVGNPRSAMAPVHWKGWMMFGVFIASMLIGAFGAALSILSGQYLWGIVVFVALTGMGAGMLLMSVAQHGDNTKTVEEHRRDAV